MVPKNEEKKISGERQKSLADVRGQRLELADWLEAVKKQQEGPAGYIQILQSSTSEHNTHLTLKQFGHFIEVPVAAHVYIIYWPVYVVIPHLFAQNKLGLKVPCVKFGSIFMG